VERSGGGSKADGAGEEECQPFQVTAPRLLGDCRSSGPFKKVLLGNALLGGLDDGHCGLCRVPLSSSLPLSPNIDTPSGPETKAAKGDPKAQQAPKL
jgi:hypothetical protein